MSAPNPLGPILKQQPFIVLDGGLATTLEAMGHELTDALWSARLLVENPEAIQAVHLAFLKAGADCLITSSYQASLQGFMGRGFSQDDATELLRRSVALAIAARDDFWRDERHRRGRFLPLIAASIGPYGAYLADGSEYTGDYDLSDNDLDVFHRERWRILATTQADLLACETLPSRRELQVLLKLLAETPGRWAWMSFSCRDSTHLNDGSRLVEAAQDCDRCPQVAAIGINCTAPEYIASLISEARRGTSKPILVYPNLGEPYDADRKVWLSGPEVNWRRMSSEWVASGAAGIGGCCRVGPEVIARLRQHGIVQAV